MRRVHPASVPAEAFTATHAFSSLLESIDPLSATFNAAHGGEKASLLVRPHAQRVTVLQSRCWALLADLILPLPQSVFGDRDIDINLPNRHHPSPRLSLRQIEEPGIAH